jgi:glycine cleavage system H protein
MNEEKAMEFPDDLKYTREHEWLLVEDKIATVGITDFAQEQLGDVVFVELPAVGDKVTKDEAMGVIESVKAVSDVYAPVSGKVLEVNDDLPESTEMVNEDPYGDGWMVKIELSDPSEIADLMTAAEYEQFVSEQEE